MNGFYSKYPKNMSTMLPSSSKCCHAHFAPSYSVRLQTLLPSISLRTPSTHKTDPTIRPPSSVFVRRSCRRLIHLVTFFAISNRLSIPTCSLTAFAGFPTHSISPRVGVRCPWDMIFTRTSPPHLHSCLDTLFLVFVVDLRVQASTRGA
jgi:hypothetical protein